jgi:hypothetical protein
MKTEKQTKDKVEQVNQKEVEKKLTHTGRVLQKRGHTLFQFNIKTRELTIAMFESAIHFDDTKKIPKKVIVQDDCLYVSALNKKNAFKKLFKK